MYRIVCASVGICRGNVPVARLAFGVNELDNVDGGTSCAVMRSHSQRTWSTGSHGSDAGHRRVGRVVV